MDGEIGDVRIEVGRGDIARQPGFDAVVNAANAALLPGGGVAGAIHRAAGPGLAEECRPLAPIAPGEAVVTGALLAACYEAALDRAEERGMASVAFPSLSTGAFGYPMEAAARVAARTVVGRAPGLESVRRIRFVLWGRDALRIHETAFEEALAGPG